MEGEFKINEEIVIEADSQKVFDFLTDPNKIPLVMPSLVSNENIPELPLVVGSKFNYDYQLYGVRLKGTWEVTQIESPTKYCATISGDVDGTFEYDLEESDGKTTLKLIMTYNPIKSVLEKASQPAIQSINANEAKHYMMNLKNALEL